MPRVSRLNIAPVRSLGLETRDEIRVEAKGVLEDRRFFVTDADGSRIVDQLIAGTMVQVAAWTDPDATVLRLTFPDGRVVEDDVRLADAIETRSTGGPASAISSTGRSRRRSASSWAGRCFSFAATSPAGRESRTPSRSSPTVRSMRSAAVLGVGVVDARRFRMLIELDGGRPHEEDTWVGGRIGLGDTILRSRRAGGALRHDHARPGHRPA